MGGYYYDYTSYLNTLISNTDTINTNLGNLFTLLGCFVFLFAIFLVYCFIRNMIRSS